MREKLEELFTKWYESVPGSFIVDATEDDWQAFLGGYTACLEMLAEHHSQPTWVTTYGIKEEMR